MSRIDKDGIKHNRKNNAKETKKRTMYSQKSVRIKEELLKKKKRNEEKIKYGTS